MKYYIYNIKRNCITVCMDFQELLKCFARYNRQVGNRTENMLFEMLSMNFNDKRVDYQWDKVKKEYVRRLVPRELVIEEELPENHKCLHCG